MFMLIERKLKTISIVTFTCFLVMVVTRYIKIHCEKFQNMNFLAQIRYFILLAQTPYGMIYTVQPKIFAGHAQLCN